MKRKFLLLIILLLIPGIVYADRVEDVDYEIKSVYIASDVDFVGSMHIKEAIIIKGSLNGFERVINYKNSRLKPWASGSEIDFSNSAIYNAKGMSLSKVSSFKINKDEINFDVLSHNMSDYSVKASASLGESGVFTLNKSSEGMGIRVYNPNTSGYVVYFFEYYIDQVVVLHNDVAELYWQFIPTDFDYINKAHIKITIPGSCTNEKFRFWAHGPLTGDIAGISTTKDENGKDLYEGIIANATNVYDGEGIDIRMTFNPSILSTNTNSLNRSGIDALEKIIEVEELRANEANEIRRIAKNRQLIFTYTGISYLVGLIIIWITIYKKYDKEYKVSFDAQYYREFTGDYDVEVVDYLMNKTISPNAMSASIMNLIYKKKIEIIENPDDKKNPTLKLLSRENVSESEKKLLSLLFDLVGKNEMLNMKDLEKYSRRYSTAEKFLKKYDTWKKEVQHTAEKENFFENHTTKKAVSGLYILIGIILSIILVGQNVFFLLSTIIFFMSFAFLIYILSFKKWTLKGRDHYLKWKAFKNFLKDFGSFKDKELPEVKLWEKYLVYATVFGLAKEVQKTMRIKLTEMGYDQVYMHNYWYYNDFYIGNRISDAVSKAYSASNAAVAASSSSSGGGYGGGFSGGGGFGGGGGSGHGF